MKYLLYPILALFLGLSLYQLELPGLHYDEAFEVVPALHLLQQQPVTAFRQGGLTIAGQTWPLMTQDYIGALNSYAALPFIALLGPTVSAVRVMSVLTGVLTLWLAYHLTVYLTDSYPTGFATASLLAVEPTFIFWNRQGVFVTAITATIGLAATYCWLRAGRQASFRWAMAGAFLVGLGLYAKFLFLWLILAGLVYGLTLLLFLMTSEWGAVRDWERPQADKDVGAPGEQSDQAGDSSRRFRPFRMTFHSPSRLFAHLLILLVAFLLGCWPLLLYNWQTGGTLIAISQNAGTSYYGVNNLAVSANLGERLYQFVVLLNGGHLWYLGQIIHNPLPPVAFGVILLGVIAGTLRGGDYRLSDNWPAVASVWLPYCLIGVTILASIVTVSALWITHFALLMPWPAIALTTGAWFVNRQLTGLVTPFTRQALFGLALAVLLTTNLASSLNYHASLTISGGLSSHSDAIYDLSDWLAERGTPPVVAMDWGLAAPITYLTAGQVTPVEVFGYQWQPDVDLTARMAQFVSQPATLYLWRAPDEIIFDRSPAFKAYYRDRNLEETIEEAFYERSGRPVLGITRLTSVD